jgi:hypothetical protein
VGTAGRIVLTGTGIALTLGAVTLLALESGEVVIARSRDWGGMSSETRTWIADEGGVAWIEAATPERPFFQNVRANPEIELWRDGRWQRCRAEVVPNPEGHEHVRHLLARKYGWKDAWIGMLADTSESVALRVSCAAS